MKRLSVHALRWPAAVALVAVVLLSAAAPGEGGPNYRPFPTIACLKARGFDIAWLSTPYSLKHTGYWATRYVGRDGHGLVATFAPSRALAQALAPTSYLTTETPWIRRNVVFLHHAGPEDGPIVSCLRSRR